MSMLPKSLKRYADRIDDYSDERAYGNPIFICYTNGWKSYTDPVGVQHSDAVDTVSDALYHVRHAIKCDCQDCR